VTTDQALLSADHLIGWHLIAAPIDRAQSRIRLDIRFMSHSNAKKASGAIELGLPSGKTQALI